MQQRFIGRQVILQHQMKATSSLFHAVNSAGLHFLKFISTALSKHSLWVQSYQRKYKNVFILHHLVLVLLKLSKSLAQQGKKNTSYNTYQWKANYLLSDIYAKHRALGKAKLHRSVLW